METNSRLLQHIVTLLNRDIDQILLEQFGIGLAQYKILITLQEQPHVQQRVIADTLAQTEASVSRQIKLLQEKSLLHIDTNPENKRAHLGELTFKGEQLVSAATKSIAAHEAAFFQGLTDKQTTQFNELLQTLHRSTCYMKHGNMQISE
jgi:DNA-binding MarR family transcriptional regulator